MIKTDNLILSASGWRKVFTISGKEDDSYSKISIEDTALVMTAAKTFLDYVKDVANKKSVSIVCGIDARPTGPAIADAVMKALIAEHVELTYLGVAAAPEIMAYSKSFDAFIYITASHNPIGHNGIKFGLCNGGVIPPAENEKIAKEFKKHCGELDSGILVDNIAHACDMGALDSVYMETLSAKDEAAACYQNFMRRVIAGTNDERAQRELFSSIKEQAEKAKIGIVCDMNGSARSTSIDSIMFKECGVEFRAINATAGSIAHGIIPERENLSWCASELERLHKEGKEQFVLGYMPDCDGDRGNIVYWNEDKNKAVALEAQEVFAISVLSELSYAAWLYRDSKDYKPAVAVNGPTSMRIDSIASSFGAKVFRAEVGEANVVSLAKEKRSEGYTVRIFGEGSNGGNITYPESVRDPLNTVFALIKLLTLNFTDGVNPNLCSTWLIRSHQKPCPCPLTISKIIKTLPLFKTTGVSEARAVMHIKTTDHALLKQRFQAEFTKRWAERKEGLLKKYGIVSYKAVTTKRTTETDNVEDFATSGSGGLKIVFLDKDGLAVAFMWMRGSGTEPVFRIMCDVKGERPDMEADLLQWEAKMIETADFGMHNKTSNKKG